MSSFFVATPSLSCSSCSAIVSPVISSLIDLIVMFALLFVIEFSLTWMS